MKITATYLCQAFDFKFVDNKYNNEFPPAYFGMPSGAKIEVMLTKAGESAIEEKEISISLPSPEPT